MPPCLPPCTLARQCHTRAVTWLPGPCPLPAARCPQGEVNQNEMVLLVREPENAYDGWAVRVDNVEHVKVGHLPRVLVCHVSMRHCRCCCCRSCCCRSRCCPA